MTIVFTKIARHDIQEITSYINKELDNALAANKFLDKLFKRVKILSQFPEIGPRIKVKDELTRTRYLVIDSYLLLYVHKDDALYITHIVYARSDYLTLLQKPNYLSK